MQEDKDSLSGVQDIGVIKANVSRVKDDTVPNVKTNVTGDEVSDLAIPGVKAELGDVDLEEEAGGAGLCPQGVPAVHGAVPGGSEE